MSEIYKINRVVNNETTHIYVFAGDKEIPVSDYSQIFSAKEIRDIQDKNIPVQIINAYIHGDDTIQRIKEKIFKPAPIAGRRGTKWDPTIINWKNSLRRPW